MTVALSEKIWQLLASVAETEEVRVSWIEGHPRLWRVLLILYYFAVIAGLIVMYGRGDFSTPPFVYQGF